jgi:hypothetical protein
LNEDRAIGDLLAADPSVNSPGAALFRGGVLLTAERVKVEKSWAKLDRGERASRVASAIIRWGIAYNMEPRFLVYEWPQVYVASKSKGDPNDLISLAAVGAELAGQLSIALIQRDICLVRLTPTPAEWIGQIPKSKTGDPWDSPRGARIKSRLTETEFRAVAPSHDAIDAAGLGLWALGRLDRIRVFEGATIDS